MTNEESFEKAIEFAVILSGLPKEKVAHLFMYDAKFNKVINTIANMIYSLSNLNKEYERFNHLSVNLEDIRVNLEDINE